MAAEDSSSWYQRKVAQMRGAQPMPGRAPVPAYQQPQQHYQQNVPQQPPAARPDSGTPPGPPPGTLTELLALQQHGQALNPGKGARLNPDPCPNCGSAFFYSDHGGKRRGPPPAPHCFNCGYNDLFEQGLESNWQGGS